MNSHIKIQSTFAALAVGVALFCNGCTTSTSTREEYEGEKRVGVIQEDDEFKFITKIRTELAREDDKKVGSDYFKRKSVSNNRVPNGLSRDGFLLEVVSYLGVEYSYGGESKRGMDCSGFTCQVFRNTTNKLLPRSTVEQFGRGGKVVESDLQFGDLVFFNTTGSSPSHVGIYIEDGVFVHASVTEGVTLSSLGSTYYKNRYVGARRILE